MKIDFLIILCHTKQNSKNHHDHPIAYVNIGSAAVNTDRTVVGPNRTTYAG